MPEDPARIAVIVDRLQDWQVPLIQGLESRLHPVGVTVLVIVNHPLHPRRGGMIKRMVTGGRVQGMVLTPLTDASTGASRISEILRVAGPLPAVTVGTSHPGVPSIHTDHVGDMKMALDHLIDDCGRRRPVLVMGANDASEPYSKFEAFSSLSADRGLSLPEVFVFDGCVDRDSAYRAVSQAVRGRAADAIAFDSAIATSDELAVGVLDALQDAGIHVPNQVSVVGFGNTELAYFSNPTLSSIEQHLHAQGAAAASRLLSLMGRTPTAEAPLPPGDLVVRMSSNQMPSSALRTTPTHVFDALAEYPRQWLPRVLAGAVSPDENAQLEARLSRLVLAHPEPVWWRQLLSTLQQDISAQTNGLANEAMSLRVRLYVEQALSEAREERDRAEHAVSHHILELTRSLTECRSVGQMVRTVTAFLPRLRIKRLFLVLVRPMAKESSQPDQAEVPAELAMCYIDGSTGRFPSAGNDPGEPGSRIFAPYNAPELLPPELRSELYRGTLTVQPLFSEEQWFGLMLHEQSPLDRHTGEALRLDISRVLDTVHRAVELTHRAEDLQTLVAARTAELKLEIDSRRAAQAGLKAANERLREALLRDGMTGLFNRPTLDLRLADEWNRCKETGAPLSILMCDVDHFKLYNDSYGHLAGDDCLKRIADCLKAAGRRDTDFVARYGGEEFTVVLPGSGPSAATAVAKRILQTIRAAQIPHPALGAGRSVTISVGAAVAADESELVDLLARADAALYRAKQSGRDAVQLAG